MGGALPKRRDRAKGCYWLLRKDYGSMDNKGHSADETGIDNKSVDNGRNTDGACADRNNTISGYKKFLTVVFIFALICCFRAYVIDRVIVSGNSMNPYFSDGDVMWARKFDVLALERYQVVVAKADELFVIKRVIGLPNETVQIIDGFVYIDGEKLNGDYGYQTRIYGKAINEITLADNEYFIMGDNRDDSLDCRVWGSVSGNDIKGIVVFRFFPFWKIGAIERRKGNI